MTLSGRRVAAMVGALGVALALSGCGNAIEDAVNDAVGNAVENGVEGAVENASGGDVEIDVNADGGSVDLPDTFPPGIPLPEGATLTSTFGADGGWSLQYLAADSGPMDALEAEFRSDSAWTLEQESSGEGMNTWGFTNGEYQVVLVSVGDGTTEYLLGLTLTPISE